MRDLRGEYSIPGTSFRTDFDHCRDDYHRGHGLHCHIYDTAARERIASINLESLTIMAGSLDGRDGREAMKWIQQNNSTLLDDAKYWRDNGSVY